MKLFNCTWCGDPNGIRTRATAVKGRRPRPLNDGAERLRSARAYRMTTDAQAYGIPKEKPNRGALAVAQSGDGREISRIGAGQRVTFCEGSPAGVAFDGPRRTSESGFAQDRPGLGFRRVRC